jgi:GTP-binding protein EngB required for normal cell division
MPGYGKSLKASRGVEEQTKDAILDFLRENAKVIRLAVHVVNASTFLETTQRLDKKGFIPLDVEMVHYIKRDLGIPVLVAANKIDKNGDADTEDNLTALKDMMGPTIPVYAVSARTGQGMGQLKDEIHRRLVDRGYKNPFELLG